jgi:hypothetical protein
MKIIKSAIYLLLTILVTNSYSQSKLYTSFASGLSFHKINNKEDSKTTDFVLHQKPYETKKYKFSVPLQLQLGYLFSKHFGLEISPSICYITTSWWSYGIDNRYYNRQIALNNYIFPLSFLYSNNISKKINFRAQVGGFINYVPKYTYRNSNGNYNINVPDRSFYETFTTLDGQLIQSSDSGKMVVIRYKLNQPLITKIQYGYTGAILLGYDISPTVNIFFQVQVFKTITDLENKKDITMTRTYENGTQDVIKFNYYSNMYKQFFTREPNDLNNRPKSTVAILNTLLGIRYNFREKKDNTFRIE